jgi:hypothetical protein
MRYSAAGEENMTAGKHTTTLLLFRIGIMTKLSLNFLVSSLFLYCWLSVVSAQPATNKFSPTNSPASTNAVKGEMDAAIHQVERIVNQPVTAYRQIPDMHVSVFKEGWFHPGAAKPNFDTVDIRQSQETPYAKYQYVSSDLNPGIAFVGPQLEFNSMTKYFYTNRTLPKKKLTQAEMEEINRLYRIIGRCEHQLALPEPPPVAEPASTLGSSPGAPATIPARRSVFLNPWIAGALILGVVLVVFFNRLARS